MNDWLAKKKDFLWFFIWTVSLVSAGDIQSERELQDALQFQFLSTVLSIYCRIVCFTPYISSSNTLVLSHLRIYFSWWQWQKSKRWSFKIVPTTLVYIIFTPFCWVRLGAKYIFLLLFVGSDPGQVTYFYPYVLGQIRAKICTYVHPFL